MSTYDFSTLYTTLPHHLIKDKLIDLINRTFIRKNTHYLTCNKECAFFTSDVYNSHNLWSCQKVCDALVYLLDNIFIRFGAKLYRQTIGIPMGTNCAPLVADLFLFCYERDFMKSLSRENRADIIEAFYSTSRYLDDLLNIDNIYFGHKAYCIYPTEIQLTAANSSDTEAPFLEFPPKVMINGTILILIWSISLFWLAMSPGVPHMGYTYLKLLDSPELLQILVTLTTVIKPLLLNFLGRAIVILNFVRRFRNFIADSALIEKYSVSLKTVLQQGISESEFYGYLVYKFRKIVGKSNFSEQFRKLINHYKRIGYGLDIIRQTACLVVNSIIVDGYASLFNCTTAVRASDSMTASS